MQFIVKRDILLKSLNFVQGVVEKKNTLPILSNVLLQLKDNKLLIVATDLDIVFHDEIEDIKIQKEGSTTTSAAILYDILRKISPNSEINFNLKTENKLSLNSDNSDFNLLCLPIGNFPTFADEFEGSEFEINKNNFLKLLNKTKIAISNDDTRHYLNGIYLHLSKNLVSTVATDGHRLSKSSLTKDFSGDFDGIIIPKKTVLEISKILEEFEGKISLNFSKTRLKIILGHIKIITKLINSSFPDYESVIPTANDQIMEVDCKSFSESIDRVSTISNEKFRTVKFDVSNNVCVVSSFGTEKSIGTENVKVGYSGPAFSINFNSRYVLDVLNIIKEGKVKFFFSKDTAPTILETPSIKNSLFLIMQMRA